MGEEDVRMIWKKYFESLCNVDKERGLEQICVALLVLENVIILRKKK